MKLDLMPVYAAFGIGLTTYLILRLKKINPGVRFKTIQYDKSGNEIHVSVENVSSETVYVRPAIRVVRLTPVDEWRRSVSQSSNIPMMAASAGSVIKGYDLIGEYAEAVPVEPGKTSVITYPVRREFGLRALDNIKVDSPVGADPRQMHGTVTETVRLTFNEETSEFIEKEILGILDDATLKSQYDGGVEFKPQADPNSDRTVSSLKGDFPSSSACIVCGGKWLAGASEGRHVCSCCGGRRFKDNHTVLKGSSYEIDEDIGGCGEHQNVEFVEARSICVKPRHQRILDLLNAENTASSKELAFRLRRPKKAVAEDLRHLFRNNLVDRVKIAGKYKYFAVKEADQIILPKLQEESKGQIKWT